MSWVCPLPTPPGSRFCGGDLDKGSVLRSSKVDTGVGGEGRGRSSCNKGLGWSPGGRGARMALESFSDLRQGVWAVIPYYGLNCIPQIRMLKP